MNRQELQSKLTLAGVHPSLYSLGELAQQSESYSLVPDGAIWKVLYKERGEFHELRTDLSESEGCLLIYELLDESLGFSSQFSGQPRGA